MFQSGDVVKIVASDTIYSAFHNDDPIMSWVDSGVIHPVGADQRWVDISAGQTLLNNLQTIDNIEAGDAVGGVQLVALNGVLSTGVVGSPTFQNDVTLTPAAAQLTLTGNAPALIQGVGLTPATGALTLTGNVGTVQVMTPTPEINTPHTGTAVPVQRGRRWVTLRGAGGRRRRVRELGCGRMPVSVAAAAAAARVIKRSWIPRSAMGETYSVEVGVGWGRWSCMENYGSPGGRARFVSGFVDWKANGGAGGFRRPHRHCALWM